MSWLAYLGWTERDGTRRHEHVALPVETVMGIVAAMDLDLLDGAHVVVPVERLEHWKDGTWPNSQG